MNIFIHAFLHLLNVADSSMLHECFQVFSSVCTVFKCSKLRDFCKPNSTQFLVFSLSQVIGCSYGRWTNWLSTMMLVGCSCDQLRMMLADNFLWYNKIELRIRILWCKNLLLGTCFVYVIILGNEFAAFMLIFWQWTCFVNLLAIILVRNCWALEICFVGSNWLGTCFVLNR